MLRHLPTMPFARLLISLLTVVLVGCQAAPLAQPTPTPVPAPSAAAQPTPKPALAQPTLARPTSTPTTFPKPPPTPLPVEPTPVGANLDPRFGIAEGFRNPAVMGEIGAGWERVVLSWADIQPDGPGDFSWLGRTLPPRALAGELNRGVRMAGLLQFTPEWAATDKRDPGRSVPRNLDLADDDPDNYWGRFVYETVLYYTGRIDEWIVWNEPEFKPDDAAGGGTYTWLGSDVEFARLMEVAYLAAKRANPQAVVSFPGTSYWIDQNSGRPQFYERYLQLVATDRRARDHNLYHDAVSLNLYRAPDDLVRVERVFKDIQRAYDVDRPLWLLELNAMPTEDRTIRCADRHAFNPIQTTMAEQSAYAVQALALAAASNYQRIGFYMMVDDNPCNQSAVWGVTRDDGSPRPVAQTLQTAVHAFSGFRRAEFAPLIRSQRRWSPWPDDPRSLIPNWQIYLVGLDMPSGRRVTVLWNGDGVVRTVRVARRGSRAHVLDMHGARFNARTAGTDWLLDLPAATAHFSGDPTGYFFIGGEPVLLIEDEVPERAPITPPQLV